MSVRGLLFGPQACAMMLNTASTELAAAAVSCRQLCLQRATALFARACLTL